MTRDQFGPDAVHFLARGRGGGLGYQGGFNDGPPPNRYGGPSGPGGGPGGPGGYGPPGGGPGFGPPGGSGPGGFGGDRGYLKREGPGGYDDRDSKRPRY
jgi:U1 small nuclear ribonucleoprotein